jgi:hypothetical protein
MKKIKSKKQLQEAKKRIKLRKAELGKKMRNQWNELKDSLRPVNIAKDSFNSFMDKKAAKNLQDDSILKSTLNYGISLLAKKFMDKAGEKFNWLFRKQET